MLVVMIDEFDDLVFENAGEIIVLLFADYSYPPLKPPNDPN